MSSLFQFAMAAWLPFLRRIVTPIVSGTALMLIAVAVMPIAVGRLTDVPAGAPEGGGLVAAGVTLAVATGMVLRAAGIWRLWAPLSGILAGCAAALFFGLYDLRPVAEVTCGRADVEARLDFVLWVDTVADLNVGVRVGETEKNSRRLNQLQKALTLLKNVK